MKDHPHMQEMWKCPECEFQFAIVSRHHDHAECKCGQSLLRKFHVVLVPKKGHVAELYFRSDQQTSSDPLVSFLYELMRDHVPLSTVEGIVLRSPLEETHFTNGWLARYAKDVADRLKGK